MPAPVQRALGLLELLLVIAIIVTLGAIAAPRYANATNRYRADAAARRIAADLNQARAAAKAMSTSVTVSFDLMTSSYVVQGVTSLDRRSASSTVMLAEEPYRVELFVASFGMDAQIVYDGYGVPDSGGSVYVQCAGFLKGVEVDMTSGEATVQ